MDTNLMRHTAQLFLEHPHTWLLIRIFAVLRLFWCWEPWGFLLLFDVVRTLFLNNENYSVECQTESLDDSGIASTSSEVRISASTFDGVDGQTQTDVPPVACASTVECQTEWTLQTASISCQTENVIRNSEERDCQTTFVEVSDSSCMTESVEAMRPVDFDGFDSYQRKSTEASAKFLLSDTTEVDDGTDGQSPNSTEASMQTEMEIFTIDDGYFTDQKEPGTSVEIQTDTVEIAVDNLLDLQDTTTVFSSSTSLSTVDSGVQTDCCGGDSCSRGMQTCLTETVDQVIAWIESGSKSVKSRSLDDFEVNEALAEELEQIRGLRDESERKNHELQAEVLKVNNYVKTLQVTLENDRLETEELQLQLESLTLNKENRPTNCATFSEARRNSMADLNERLAVKSATCLELEELLEQTRAELDSRPAIRADVFNNFCKEYEDMRKILEQREKDLQSNIASLTEQKDLVAELQEELDAKTRTADMYEEQVDTDISLIEELKKSLELANGKVSEQEDQIEQLTSQIQECMEKMDDMRMDVACITSSAQNNTTRMQISAFSPTTREHATSMSQPSFFAHESHSAHMVSIGTETDPAVAPSTVSVGTVTDPVELTSEPLSLPPVTSLSLFRPLVNSTPTSTAARSALSRPGDLLSVTRSFTRGPQLQRPLSPVREKRKAIELINSATKQSGGGLRKRMSNFPSAPNVNVWPTGDRRSTLGVSQGGNLLRSTALGGLNHQQAQNPISHVKSGRTLPGLPAVQQSPFPYSSNVFSYQHQSDNGLSRPRVSDYRGRQSHSSMVATPNCPQQ